MRSTGRKVRVRWRKVYHIVIKIIERLIKKKRVKTQSIVINETNA